MTFKALLATKEGEIISTNLVDLEEKDLMSGDVTIAVDYSTVNYKDGVALTGRAPIFRTFPMIRASIFPAQSKPRLTRALKWGIRLLPMAGASVRLITAATRKKLS
jgi:acrylyl-CoA reductase (NADPH)